MSKRSFTCVFPGQGSQSLGMLDALAASYPEVKKVFDEASEVLSYDAWKLSQEGPQEKLNQTQITQPLLLAAGVAVWRVFESQGGHFPQALAGHSLGEYTALVCAGVLPFADAVALVAYRAEVMQAAVPAGQGAMAAILGLDDKEVIAACDKAAEGQVVTAANFNSPGQVVIAGETTAVTRAIEEAKKSGAKRAILLPVSVPSHCALMAPAAELMAKRLEALTLGAPMVSICHNVDASLSKDAEQIKNRLVEQLSQPVHWSQSMETLSNTGVQAMFECGPGKVLSGLAKRIQKEWTIIPMGTPEGIEKAVHWIEGKNL